MTDNPDDPDHDDPRLVELMGLHATGIPELDDVPVATHWPSLPPGKASKEWRDLRDWVEELQERFSHLDHHVIPSCWWQHNQHVEALAALRDHEKVSYSPLAPATAPVDWLRALRDVTGMLRAWTADYPCGRDHQPVHARPRPVDEAAWDAHVIRDCEHRRAATSPHSRRPSS